jgi:hypothetical protein
MWTKQFWVDSAERAIRTFAQALVAILGAGAVNILTIDWIQALSVAAGAALLSVLTSVASSGIGIKGSPSLLPEASGDPKILSAPEATSEADLDAADIDIEEWNAKRGNPAPDLTDDDPDPADVRDTEPTPKDDAK